MDETWMDELRALDGALEALPTAAAQVERQVRRRRARRRALGAAASAAVVATVVVAVTVSTGSTPGAERPGPAVSPSPATDRCPTLQDGVDPIQARYGAPPPISDLDHQREIVDDITSARFEDGSVQRAEPSHLGVVALVTGDLVSMKEALSRRGVAHVYRWDPRIKQAGVDGHGQIEQALQWIIGPAVTMLQKVSAGVAGQAGVGYWQDAGAAVLQWKAPVPPEIEALAGTRPDGVRVVVQPVRYSQTEIVRAGRKAFAAAGRLGVSVQGSSGCYDGSGIVVGISPETLGNRTEELERKLAEVVGMPVTVVAEQIVLG